MFTKLTKTTLCKLARGIVVLRSPFEKDITDDLYQNNVDYISTYRVLTIDHKNNIAALSITHLNRVDGCNTVARNDDFFVNRTAGLVKMRLHNYVNRVWELQRFHISR